MNTPHTAGSGAIVYDGATLKLGVSGVTPSARPALEPRHDRVAEPEISLHVLEPPYAHAFGEALHGGVELRPTGTRPSLGRPGAAGASSPHGIAGIRTVEDTAGGCRRPA